MSKPFERTLTGLGYLGFLLALGMVVVGCIKVFGFRVPGKKISTKEMVVTAFDGTSLVFHMIIPLLHHFPKLPLRGRFLPVITFGLGVTIKGLLLAAFIMVLEGMITSHHLVGVEQVLGWTLVGLQVASLLIGCLILFLSWVQRVMLKYMGPLIGQDAGEGAGVGFELQIVQGIAHGEGIQT